MLGSIDIAVSPHLDGCWLLRSPPEMMVVGPRAYREVQWEASEASKWAGRDWRRIKRERRKFVSRRAA